MSATAHPDDLSLADIEKFLCAPYGQPFEQLAGFPAPSYTAGGKRGGPRWVCFDVTPWLTGFFRGLAPTVPAFHEAVRAEAALRPDAPAAEHRERALDRFTQVATARVLMKRLP